MNRNDFLKALTVKHGTITLDTLEGVEVKVRELTINENMAVDEVRKRVVSGELTGKDIFIETCRYAMVEPAFFTDEELSNISMTGIAVMSEIYMKLPEITMSEDQKVIYREKLNDSINKTAKKITQEEMEAQKKQKKGSSLN